MTYSELEKAIELKVKIDEKRELLDELGDFRNEARGEEVCFTIQGETLTLSIPYSKSSFDDWAQATGILLESEMRDLLIELGKI